MIVNYSRFATFVQFICISLLCHYQVWLMQRFGRLKFKREHFLLKAFYYVCFYAEAATSLDFVCAAFTVSPPVTLPLLPAVESWWGFMSL